MKKFILEFAVVIVGVLFWEFIKICFRKEEKNNDVRFETFVFFDERNVLHTDSKCVGLEKATQNQNTRWASIWNLKGIDVEKMCSRCVSEEQSEKLRDLTKDK